MGWDCRSAGKRKRSIMALAVRVPSSVFTSSPISWMKS